MPDIACHHAILISRINDVACRHASVVIVPRAALCERRLYFVFFVVFVQIETMIQHV
jgi:hypothetical protein